MRTDIKLRSHLLDSIFHKGSDTVWLVNAGPGVNKEIAQWTLGDENLFDNSNDAFQRGDLETEEFVDNKTIYDLQNTTVGKCWAAQAGAKENISGDQYTARLEKYLEQKRGYSTMLRTGRALVAAFLTDTLLRKPPYETTTLTDNDIVVKHRALYRGGYSNKQVQAARTKLLKFGVSEDKIKSMLDNLNIHQSTYTMRECAKAMRCASEGSEKEAAAVWEITEEEKEAAKRSDCGTTADYFDDNDISAAATESGYKSDDAGTSWADIDSNSDADDVDESEVKPVRGILCERQYGWLKYYISPEHHRYNDRVNLYERESNKPWGVRRPLPIESHELMDLGEGNEEYARTVHKEIATHNNKNAIRRIEQRKRKADSVVFGTGSAGDKPKMSRVSAGDSGGVVGIVLPKKKKGLPIFCSH